MGNVVITWTLWVTLAALLLINIAVVGEVHSMCRPFCHLPKDTHESCNGLRFLFPCINSVQLKCNLDLHCSCEWSHALEHLKSERVAGVRQSNVFQDCLSKLREDCDEWKEKWSHIPCQRVLKKPDTTNSENPSLSLKLAEIRAGIMRLTNVAKRQQLLAHLDNLVKKRPWEKIRGNETGGSNNSSSSLRLLVERPKASAARGQQGNYTVMEWMNSIDSWHQKVLFEHWEKVSEADIVETLRRRRTFLLIFGVLTGGTAFIIVMLFVIKYQSDKNVRKDITFDGNLDSMVKTQTDSFSFLDKLRKEKNRKSNRSQPRTYQMSSLTNCPDTNPKTDHRRNVQTSTSSSRPTAEQQTKHQQSNAERNRGSSAPCTKPRTEQSPEPRKEQRTEPRTENNTAPRTTNNTEPRTANGTEPRTANDTAPHTTNGTEPRTANDTAPRTTNGTEPHRAHCTGPRSATPTESRSDHLVPVEAIKSSSSFDIGDQLFPSAMMRNFGADVNGSFLSVYQENTINPYTPFVAENPRTTSPEKPKEKSSTLQDMRSTSPEKSRDTEKPSTSKDIGTVSPRKLQESEYPSTSKTVQSTSQAKPEKTHVISLSRDKFSFSPEEPNETNKPSTSQKLRPSQDTPNDTPKPMTSQTVRSTSPALIPVTQVTTVKVSSKRFLSSSDSSTSSSSSSSLTSATTTTGSPNSDKA